MNLSLRRFVKWQMISQCPRGIRTHMQSLVHLADHQENAEITVVLALGFSGKYAHQRASACVSCVTWASPGLATRLGIERSKVPGRRSREGEVLEAALCLRSVENRC
jgi:hypothetical protein